MTIDEDTALKLAGYYKKKTSTISEHGFCETWKKEDSDSKHVITLQVFIKNNSSNKASTEEKEKIPTKQERGDKRSPPSFLHFCCYKKLVANQKLGTSYNSEAQILFFKPLMSDFYIQHFLYRLLNQRYDEIDKELSRKTPLEHNFQEGVTSWYLGLKTPLLEGYLNHAVFLTTFLCILGEDSLCYPCRHLFSSSPSYVELSSAWHKNLSETPKTKREENWSISSLFFTLKEIAS